MKKTVFTVSKDALLNPVQIGAKVASSKNSIPCLDNLLFIVDKENSCINIKSSDLEIELTSKLEVLFESAEVEKFLIPARTLFDSVKLIAEQPITISVSDLYIEVKYNGGHFHFPMTNVDEFPLSKLSEKEWEFGVNSAVFEKIISEQVPFLSSDELRPSLCSVLIESDGPNIVSCSTNMHVLSLITNDMHVPSLSDQNIKMLITRKVCSVIRDIAAEENMVIEKRGKHILLTQKDTTIIFRECEAAYPNYKSVIPKDYTLSCLIPKDEFVNALNRVSAFSNRVTNMVVLDFKDDSVRIMTEDIDYSLSAEENISITKQSPSMVLKIGFNINILKLAASNISTQNISINANSAQSAIILKPEGSEDDTNLKLVMPVLINN